MKNTKNNKLKKSNCFILKDSIKVINKHFSELTISISGELAFGNTILIQRHFYKNNFEMF